MSKPLPPAPAESAVGPCPCTLINFNIKSHVNLLTIITFYLTCRHLFYIKDIFDQIVFLLFPTSKKAWSSLSTLKDMEFYFKEGFEMLL